MGVRHARLDLVALVEQAQDMAEFEAAVAQAVRAQPVDASALLQFLEIPTGNSFDVPPSQAIAYFKAKGLRPSFSYADMRGAAHDTSFTVSKMMDVDMLSQVQSSLDSALANGQTFKEWADTITPVLQSGGWWGRKAVLDPLTGKEIVSQLGSPWRLETIFRTNMQTAYAAGQWQEIEAQADVAPLLMYDAVDDFRTRPLHRAWDKTLLPWNHAWWKTHYPPNGYNCRCGVIQLSEEEAEAMGLQIAAKTPDAGTYKWTNPRTGEVHQVPNGLDPGFDRNAGIDRKAQIENLLNEKIAVLPSDMQLAAEKAKQQVDATLAAAKSAQAEVAAAAADAALARAKALVAEKSAQWSAQAQIDAIAKGGAANSGSALKVKALAAAKKTPGFGALKPTEQLAQVNADAAALKAKADLSKGLSLYKTQILAGKTPTPAAVKAFKSLADDEATAFLKKIDEAKAAAEAAAAKAAAAAPKVVVGAPPDPQTLTKIGDQRGSNPGGTYQDTATGVKWYVKQPAGADIARNEVLAGKLYELAGIEVPEMHLITLDGRTGIASRIVDGLQKVDAATLAKAAGTAEGFAVDAWLANWDVVGLGFDNLLMQGARAFRVDTGGALRYRAQGGLKGGAWGRTVNEIDSLRDSTNAQSRAVFGKLTTEQIEASVERVLRVSEADIRAMVEAFGPEDVAERQLLADTLIMRQRDMAQRFPAAAQRVRGAGAEVAGARVTAAEQAAVEQSRVNGYGFATDGDQIEDHMVLVHSFKRADGTDATRGFFKLLPGASGELRKRIAAAAGSGPSVQLGNVRDSILAAVKSINVRADKAQPLDETAAGKIKTALTGIDVAVRDLRAAAKTAKAPAKLLEKADALDEWRAVLAPVLVDAQAARKAVKLPKVFDTKAFPDELGYTPKTAGAAPAGPAWKKVSGTFEFTTARFERSHATETADKWRVAGTTMRYEAELPDGTKVTYFPHDPANAWAMQGIVQIDAPGSGLTSTQRIFSGLDEIGMQSARAGEVDRQHLYLNAFARLRLARAPMAKFRAEFDAVADRTSDGVQRKLDILKRATGVDVAVSDGWKTADGVRQAFGHGRTYQFRPDMDATALRELDRTHVLFHNPQGLGADAGSGVFEKLKPIINGGGTFASLTDRVRRGVPLGGSSVESDLASGGGDYHFTRIRPRSASGSGVYWKVNALRRMDAITYDSDRFGRTTTGYLEEHRLGQTADDFKRVASLSGNETIFKAGMSIFDDIDRIVLASAGEVKDAIAWMQQKGYKTWPDGRPLAEVIITKAKHRAKP